MAPTRTTNQAVPRAVIDPDCPSTGRHGDRQAYLSDRCRCPSGRRAATRYRKRWAVDKLAGRERLIDSTGLRRRIQALIAVGWDQGTLAARLGMAGRTSIQGMMRYDRVRRSTAARVAVLYDQLAATPGPSAHGIADARRRGYAPPDAWDGDTIDDPAATPYDWRREPDAPLVIDAEDIRHLRRFGMDDEAIARTYNIDPARVLAQDERRQLARRDDPERVAAAVLAVMEGRGAPTEGLTRRERVLAALALAEGGYSLDELSRHMGRAAETIRAWVGQGRTVRASLPPGYAELVTDAVTAGAEQRTRAA